MGKGGRIVLQKKIMERVIGRRMVKGKTEYLVVWRGKMKSEAEWVQDSFLANGMRLINDFLKTLRRKTREGVRKRLAIKNIRQNIQRDEEKEEKPMTIDELKDKLNQMTFSDEGNQMQPEACISLLSDSEPEEELMIREEVRRVPRFDCLTGEWIQREYSLEEFEKISRLWADHAFQQEKQKIAVLNIVKVDDELVVQYTRNGEKFQCLLEHFKTYDSSSLIEYILKQYDPNKHEVKKLDLKADSKPKVDSRPKVVSRPSSSFQRFKNPWKQVSN